jgi:hypothetical protein
MHSKKNRVLYADVNVLLSLRSIMNSYFFCVFFNYPMRHIHGHFYNQIKHFFFPLVLGLNSGLSTFKAGAVMLEPLLQSKDKAFFFKGK